MVGNKPKEYIVSVQCDPVSWAHISIISFYEVHGRLRYYFGMMDDGSAPRLHAFRMIEAIRCALYNTKRRLDYEFIPLDN